MTLYICGNSHTRALRRGASILEQNGADPMIVFPLGTADNEANPFSTIQDGRVVLTNWRFRNKLEKFFGFTSFDPNLRWGICVASHAATFGKPSWGSAAPSWLNLPDKTPISENLFEKIVEQDQQHSRAFLKQLLETGVKPIAISAPWPVRWHPVLTEHGASPEVVRAVDTRARVLYAKWLHRHGIPIVTPPAETADEDGFLKPEFCKAQDDFYHGNGRYGTLMMEKVLQTLDNMATSPTSVLMKKA